MRFLANLKRTMVKECPTTYGKQSIELLTLAKKKQNGGSINTEKKIKLPINYVLLSPPRVVV
jgi:hypothetical protein